MGECVGAAEAFQGHVPHSHLEGHCPGGRAVKGDADFLLSCPVYLDRWKLVLACRQGCRQRQSKSFPMLFQLLLLLEQHPLRARLCKQMWLVVISVLTLWLTSDYGCDSVSAFPAFLDTLLNSSFESHHSHLFLSNWLSHQAQKNPFPLTLTVTPWKSEVQLNGLARSAGDFYGNWLVFWDFTNLPLATKRCCCIPSSIFPLLFFGLFLPLLLWHLRTCDF